MRAILIATFLAAMPAYAAPADLTPEEIKRAIVKLTPEQIAHAKTVARRMEQRKRNAAEIAQIEADTEQCQRLVAARTKVGRPVNYKACLAELGWGPQ